MKRDLAIGLALLATGATAGTLHHDMLSPQPKGTTSVTAAVSGSWFDPNTWGGNLPAENDSVRVPAGVTVTYDGVSDAAIARIDVDGVLQFSTSQSSRLVVDLLWVEAGGQLEIGRPGQPVAAGTQVDIRFADAGDLDPTTDPSLLGRGLVASGTVRIHGARKSVHSKVAVDPRAGDTVLTLAETPENWSVGDTLVLAGTRYSGWRWDNDIRAVRYFGSEDEVLTITAVNGRDISFTPALAYDHLTPRPDLKTSVANFTRNVSFATANPSVPRHQRAHVMFMHNDDIDVRYASFWHLGRTSKSLDSLEAADFGTIAADSNVRGRYPFHIHRAGVATPRQPAVVIGNAVYASPGWGYVHHDSNAIFHNNASYDTFGAGFVAETGNEIGTWTHNIAIRAEGNSAFNPKNGNDVDTFDMGRTGDGFWFQGRMVKSVGNIAASVNHGFVYLHRGTGMLTFEGDIFSLPEALPRGRQTAPDDAPILGFHQNESFASTVGLYVVKANPNQGHDIQSHLTDFLAWEVEAGAALEYTSHYALEGFDLVGKSPEPFNNAQFGIDFGTNTTDMVVVNARIAGFPTGISLGKDFTNEGVPPEANQYVIIDATMTDVAEPYALYDPTIDQLLTTADLSANRMDITLDNEPQEYLSPATSAGSGVVYTGLKTDSIGPIPIPAGTDALGTPSYDMIAITAEDGYYRTAGGEIYAVVEEYFSDRATGEIHKRGLKTSLGPDVVNLLGSQFHAWRDAFERGPIDLASRPPVAVDDQAETTRDSAVNIVLTGNDFDPDADPLSVDGLTPPIHGLVFDNGDGSVLYRPDYDFVGTDRFRYWASDGQGNFSPAEVVVTVNASGPDALFANSFE